MKKVLIISIVSIVVLAIVYFLILKPLGIFQSASRKVKQRILELQALPGKGANDYGYTEDEWLRRRAIRELLVEGLLKLDDLTSSTKACISGYQRQITQDPGWMGTIRSEVDSGRWKNEQEGIFSNAVYQCWTGEGEFEIA